MLSYSMWTDMTKLIVAFCSFSNAPKIYIKILKMMRFKFTHTHTHTHNKKIISVIIELIDKFVNSAPVYQSVTLISYKI